MAALLFMAGVAATCVVLFSGALPMLLFCVLILLASAASAWFGEVWYDYRERKRVAKQRHAAGLDGEGL